MEEEREPEPDQEGSQPPKPHNTAANVEIQDNDGKNGIVPENKTRSFKCNACLETFPTKTALSVHYNSASHIQRMTTGSSKQQGGDNEPQPPSVPVLSRPYISNKPYQCATCRVSYNHAITLESHMKSVLHQTRSRNATSNAAAAGSSGGSSNSVPPNTAVGTTGCGATQLVTTTNCAAPGNLLVTAKDGEHIQASAAGPSLLSSPVASAQAVSAFLTLLTSGPNSLSHSLLPSVFAAGAAPGAAASQLVHQPQMLMPLILNGLQAQTQQSPDSQPGQLLPQCVPLLGLNAAQQALLAQRLSSLHNQWPAVGIQATTQACPEEQKEGVKCEGEQVKQDSDDAVQEKGSVKMEDMDSWTIESGKREKDEEEDSKEFEQGLKMASKTIKVEKDGEAGKTDRDSTTDGGGSTDQLGLDGGDNVASLNLSPMATDKSFRNNHLSPSASVPSNSSLSPVNFNLTLSPDSTPQKSQAGTSPCGSLGTPKSSPYKNALISPDCHNVRGWHVSSGPPVLSDFQSEVLWAFFESRSEADAVSPPREDCEALGREVGLSEDEVRRWLSHARLTKERRRAAGMEHRHGLAGYTRHSRGLDNDYDEEESSLMIVEEEEEDSAEASSSQALDLSSSRGKRREREVGRESQGDSCLTSDSENEEVYTSIIVSEEESQNESMREAPDSPVKDEAQRQPAGDKGLSGGKVLRSTTVFLSDAEDEYEEEESGGGQRLMRQKRKREYEREEVEAKKDKQDPDVDLELEAQGDPPNTLPLPINHPGLPSGILHSLPLSLSLGAFSTQFLSPYILSLPPSVVGDGGKVPAFPIPPNITRFPDPLITQPLSSHGQASHYLSNGGDCESALDLSMGKNGNSKAASSSSSSSSLADIASVQKGRLLDGLGLRPTSKGLIVVQVKPEPGAPSNSSGLFNCNNMNKSSIYMRAAEKMNATLLEREKDNDKDKDKDPRKSKGKRYRDMRRSRTIIRAEQLDILYGCYFKDPNPGKHEFEQISEWVHLPKKVVQIWFQNMRARERKGEVRFISDGTLAAVGKPLIKFTWPLSKPIFSNKPSTNNNTGSITATPIVRTLIKTEKDPVKEMGKPEVVKNLNKVPIKPKEVVPSTAVSPMSSNMSAVPKTKLETTSNLTMVKIAPKVNTPILPAPPKEPLPVVPRPAQKRKLEEESEEEKTDEEMDDENEVRMGPGTTNRMVPKLPTTPINNKSPAATAVSQKHNGLNYWTHKGPFKINTLSREQLALPTHTPPRPIPPPPTPSIAPVSPNAPGPVKPPPAPTMPALVKTSPPDSSFLHHSTSRRPRTHLSCPQLSILQSCYETCAHPNAMECEAIGTELGLPLKVVQIWFQNTRAKEKRWRLQQEKLVSGGCIYYVTVNVGKRRPFPGNVYTHQLYG